MAGGGGKSQQTSTSTRTPWGDSQPYLDQAMKGLQGAYSTPPSYYGGPLTVGPTSAENAAWDKTNQFNTGYFGSGGQYGQAVGANASLMSGGPQAGYASSMAPGTINGLNKLGSMDPYALHQLGTAGSLDATSAIQSQLSGTPDYTGLQGAIDAANNPIMRQFQNETLPGLNSKATFLNNSTGGIKSLGTILPDVQQRMSENALALTTGERARALAAQANAMGLVTQGGLTQDSQGMQAQSDWANQRLGMGQLLGSYAGQASTNQNAGIDNASGLYNLGQMPANAAQAYAAWDRNLKQNALTADQTKFNYLRDQPQIQATNYSNSLLPYAGVGGSSTTNTTDTTPGKSLGFSDLLSGVGGLGSIMGGGGFGSMLGGGGGGKGGGAPYDASSFQVVGDNPYF